MNNLIEERDTNANNNREIISHKHDNSNRTHPLQSNLLSQPRTSNSQQDKINQPDQINVASNNIPEKNDDPEKNDIFNSVPSSANV